MKLHEYDPNYVGFTKSTFAKSDSKTAFTNWKDYQELLNPLRHNTLGKNRYMICGNAGIKNRYCIIGIDIDVDKVNIPLSQIYKDIKLPPTAVVKTPGGGYHLLYLISDYKIYHASYNHTFSLSDDRYVPNKYKKYKGIDIKGHGGLLFTHGTEWTQIKNEKKDKLGKYELISDIDLAFIKIEKITKFRNYLKLLMDTEKSKIMKLISEAKLPDGAWDDTALDIAGFLKMKNIPIEEAYHIWNTNNDLVTLQNQVNKDFISNTYKKNGGSRYEKAIALIPKLSDFITSNFGNINSDKMPDFNFIAGDVISVLVDSNNYRYDHINEIVYYRDGHIWRVDYQQEHIYNHTVVIINDKGYMSVIYDRSIQTIITKYLKTTLSIKINIDDQLLRMFSDTSNYIKFELPLRDDVLVVNREDTNNIIFSKRAYVEDDFFLFKFDNDFIFYNDNKEAINSTPKFMSFMKWFIINPKLMEFVIISSSMTLIPMYRSWNNILYLYGSGNNGKSVFTDIISSFYPIYAQSSSRFEEICGRFGYQPILHKWFIKGEESKPKYDTDLAHIRSLADLARTNVDIKRKNATEVQLTAKAIFNGNTAPILNNDGDFRRIALINCRNKMDRNDPSFDINLTDTILKDEKDAIFTFMIKKAAEAMGKLNRIKPQIIDIIRLEVEDAEDPLSYFCDNHIEMDKGDINNPPGVANYNDIYQLYLLVAKTRGYPKFAKRQVLKKIRSIFNIKGSYSYKCNGKVTKALRGIKLIYDEYESEPLSCNLNEFV